jgi:hypothetical protein
MFEEISVACVDRRRCRCARPFLLLNQKTLRKVTLARRERERVLRKAKAGLLGSGPSAKHEQIKCLSLTHQHRLSQEPALSDLNPGPMSSQRVRSSG